MPPPPAVAAGIAAALLAVALAAGFVACGDGDEARADCAESRGSNKDVLIVEAELEDGGDVLALRDCTPLYANDVDTQKQVRCTGQCASVWVPLTVPKGGSVMTRTPTPVGLASFVRRPGGRRQAALNGKPLYTYAREGEEGASGDGVADSFGGTEFTWSVVTPDEVLSGGDGTGVVGPTG